MKKLYDSEQSGRSMVEMLGVLAIIGVLSVGGIAGYSKAMAKYKTNQTLDQLSMLITNIRTLYATQPSFNGLSNANAIAFGVVSSDMIKSTTTGSGSSATTSKSLKNPFNGEVNITVDSADPTEFKVAYGGLDKSACITIATTDWGGSAASGLVSIEIGTMSGTTFTAKGTYSWGGSTGAALPLSLTDAAGACADNGNAIQWTYN